MLALKAAKIVEGAMKNGQNCCEAVLLACNEVLNLDLAPETIAAARFFREGMDSGCACGALVGIIMVSGILHGKNPHPRGSKLPAHLYGLFKKEFGSACCRIIKKERPVWQQLGRGACIDLTIRAVSMLMKEWEEIIGAEGRDFCNNYHV